MTLAEQSIGAFLAAAASTEPAPGAASAGAVALSLGLACARKALAMTLKHHPERGHLVGVEAHLAGLVDQALAGAEADMRCFTTYIEAARLPHDDAARVPAEQAALADLVAVGECLVAIGEEARGLIERVRADVIGMMANDIVTAFSLIEAARSIHLACTNESKSGLKTFRSS
jgi:formiminotetrahydrofolate cyclodeaminase